MHCPYTMLNRILKYQHCIDIDFRVAKLEPEDFANDIVGNSNGLNFNSWKSQVNNLYTSSIQSMRTTEYISSTIEYYTWHKKVDENWIDFGNKQSLIEHSKCVCNTFFCLEYLENCCAWWIYSELDPLSGLYLVKSYFVYTFVLMVLWTLQTCAMNIFRFILLLHFLC